MAILSGHTVQIKNISLKIVKLHAVSTHGRLLSIILQDHNKFYFLFQGSSYVLQLFQTGISSTIFSVVRFLIARESNLKKFLFYWRLNFVLSALFKRVNYLQLLYVPWRKSIRLSENEILETPITLANFEIRIFFT